MTVKPIEVRLSASIGLEAHRGSFEERLVFLQQCREAIDELHRLRSELQQRKRCFETYGEVVAEMVSEGLHSEIEAEYYSRLEGGL